MPYTPESYNKRVREFTSDEYDPSLFPTRTDEEIAQRRIGDAERAANTLLSKAICSHPVLSAWVNAIASSPTFHQLPSKFMNEEAVADDVSEWRQAGYGYEKGRLTYPTAPDEAPSKWEQMRDKAVLALGFAVIEHREQGEEGEDTITSAGGVGVTTSIAVALVEYHLAVCNTYAAELQYLKRGF